MEFEGRKALVTGGTSGIGREIARQLAAAGAEVVISGRDAERGAATVAAIEAAGGKARFFAADMADLDSVGLLAEQAADVDILVNNAGIFDFAPTAEQSVASYDAMFQVNVRALYFLTSAIAPRMAERGEGSVVNISTMAATVALPGGSVYSATKAAVNSLTRTWAAEFGPSGVRVNSVSPGPTLTESAPLEMVDTLGATTLLKRHADTAEIAAAVVFLASPRATYVTGATLPVDGGRAVA
ncbi:putative short chain dehydrogenase/reductase [Actinacidiphila reveromycinica]|uniref:Putative short chain dehydrogenase/reductase n=1 Tax=Actinacidiphila reveromycinica TaxID=659352 RepID=A0A7U3UNJ7_9ACTN|nr:SDR family oxidoreductase [Streptomyces sp. SN-593]BBA95834.1 putative short chain dehydrogenase/reductase [Streptomyces sp. SN-593]